VTGETFADQQDGSISGQMFNDINGDGVREISEPVLSGWTATLNPGDISATSGSNGVYSFLNVAPGIYTIAQTTPTGWRRTVPMSLPITVTVMPGEAITGINFASTTTASPGAVSTEPLATTTATAAKVVAAPPPKELALAANTGGSVAADAVQIGVAESSEEISAIPGDLADWSTAGILPADTESGELI
jgi:hypothetical protein